MENIFLPKTSWNYVLSKKYKICYESDNSKIIGIEFTHNAIYCALTYDITLEKIIPSGKYNYILALDENNKSHLFIAEYIPKEIGVKHFCILSIIPDTYVIKYAGELMTHNDDIYFNFESGTIMREIEYRGKSLKLNREFFISNFIKDVENFLYNFYYTENKIIEENILTNEKIKELCEKSDSKNIKIKEFNSEKKCRKSFHLGNDLCQKIKYT